MVVITMAMGQSSKVQDKGTADKGCAWGRCCHISTPWTSFQVRRCGRSIIVFSSSAGVLRLRASSPPSKAGVVIVNAVRGCDRGWDCRCHCQQCNPGRGVRPMVMRRSSRHRPWSLLSSATTVVVVVVRGHAPTGVIGRVARHVIDNKPMDANRSSPPLVCREHHICLRDNQTSWV